MTWKVGLSPDLSSLSEFGCTTQEAPSVWYILLYWSAWGQLRQSKGFRLLVEVHRKMKGNPSCDKKKK